MPGSRPSASRPKDVSIHCWRLTFVFGLITSGTSSASFAPAPWGLRHPDRFPKHTHRDASRQPKTPPNVAGPGLVAPACSPHLRIISVSSGCWRSTERPQSARALAAYSRARAGDDCRAGDRAGPALKSLMERILADSEDLAAPPSGGVAVPRCAAAPSSCEIPYARGAGRPSAARPAAPPASRQLPRHQYGADQRRADAV